MQPVNFIVTSEALEGKSPVDIPNTDPSKNVLYIKSPLKSPLTDGNISEWDTSMFVPVKSGIRAGLSVHNNILYAI